MEAHDSHFPPRTKDVQLLPEIGRRGWIMLTEDRRIRYRTAERDAYVEAGLGMFVLATGNLKTEQKLAVLFKAEAKIRAVVAAEVPPFLYRIATDGSLLRLA